MIFFFQMIPTGFSFHTLHLATLNNGILVEEWLDVKVEGQTKSDFYEKGAGFRRKHKSQGRRHWQWWWCLLSCMCLALADYDNDDDDDPQNANPSRGCLEAITAPVGVNTIAQRYICIYALIYNIVTRVYNSTSTMGHIHQWVHYTYASIHSQHKCKFKAHI